MTWTLDTAHSAIEFSAKHMMISTVRGSFETFNVVMNLNEQDPTKSSVEATIDLASITTREARRDAHLRSGDFFDAETYPTLTFRSTRIEPLGDNNYNLVGDLTIRDATHPVTIKVHDEGQAKDPWGNMHWGFNGETTLNRKDWNLNWNVALETGGWLVGDQIKVHVEIEAVQQVPVPAEAATAAAQ